MATASKAAEVFYPESDGKPMAETTFHRDVMIEMIVGLKDWFADDPLAYVSGNEFLYFVEGQPQQVVSPDVWFVHGIDKTRLRRSYKTWEEGGKGPDFVLEVTSRSTRREDLGKKFRLYRDDLKVREYFLFDPLGEYLKPPFQGYRLVEGEYRPIEPVDGRLPSEVLGLHLEADGCLLRLFDPATGRRLLNRLERLEARGQRPDAGGRRRVRRKDAAIHEKDAAIQEKDAALRAGRGGERAAPPGARGPPAGKKPRSGSDRLQPLARRLATAPRDPWPAEPVPVALVITDLDVGGAERALVALATGLDRRRWLPSVVALGGEGALAGPLRAAGIAVECLGVDRRRPIRAVSAAGRGAPADPAPAGPELPVPRQRRLEAGRAPGGAALGGRRAPRGRAAEALAPDARPAHEPALDRLGLRLGGGPPVQRRGRRARPRPPGRDPQRRQPRPLRPRRGRRPRGLVASPPTPS